MASTNIFKDAIIDEDEHEQYLQDVIDERKGNLTPKVVVSLKKMYDLDNCFQGHVNAKTHNYTLLDE